MERKDIKAMEKELEQAKQQAAAERRNAARERQKKYRDKQLSAGKLRAVLSLSGAQKVNLMQAILRQRQAQEKKSPESSSEGPERSNLR